MLTEIYIRLNKVDGDRWWLEMTASSNGENLFNGFVDTWDIGNLIKKVIDSWIGVTPDKIVEVVIGNATQTTA